jgi:hypothetical protein
MAGKRTERLDMPRQLRVDEDLKRDVRLLAELDSRPIGLTILRVLRRGVQSELAQFRQAAAARPDAPGPASVRRSHQASEEGVA